jgi:hypothetical protein
MSSIIKIELEGCVPLKTSDVISGSNFHPEPKIIRPSPDFRRGAIHIVVAGTPPEPMAGDMREKSGYADRMNDITREEFNAKLETIEVKMDARVESISSKIDGFLAAQAERDRRLDESISGMRRDIDRLGNLKLNIWGAMLTAVGLGVAIAALSVTFYQTGKGDKSSIPDTHSTITAPPAAAAQAPINK